MASESTPLNAHDRNLQHLRRKEASDRKKKIVGVAVFAVVAAGLLVWYSTSSSGGVAAPAGIPIANPHYIDMVDNQYNVTMVNATQLAQMKIDAVTCGELMKPCSKANVTACLEGSEFCSEKLLVPLINAKRNPYDLRMFCDKEDATECYDLSYVSKYLDAPNVREYLGVPSEHVGKWLECNNDVNAAFYETGDPGMDFSPYAEFNAAKEHAYITAAGVDAGVRSPLLKTATSAPTAATPTARNHRIITAVLALVALGALVALVVMPRKGISVTDANPF
ncbi:hypothetical protein PybrP1_010515, partial [[Pythium] brassicae (nom. inval.)]